MLIVNRQFDAERIDRLHRMLFALLPQRAIADDLPDQLAVTIDHFALDCACGLDFVDEAGFGKARAPLDELLGNVAFDAVALGRLAFFDDFDRQEVAEVVDRDAAKDQRPVVGLDPTLDQFDGNRLGTIG